MHPAEGRFIWRAYTEQSNVSDIPCRHSNTNSFKKRKFIPMLNSKSNNNNVWNTGSRDSSVGIAIGYGLDDRGVGIEVTVGSRTFSCPRCPNRPTQPPIQWIPGAISLGIMRPEREAEHSPPTSAEVKKMWLYTSTPPYAFMMWCLIS
jgi:hypothetical protein